MNYKKTLAAIAVTFSAAHLHAELPYTFVNGNVANADHVNANFTNLDSRIKEIEQNAGSGSNAGGGTGAGDGTQTFDHHPYVRDAKSTAIGEVVTVGGIEYIIVAQPFFGLADNSRHYIKFPVRKCAENSYGCRNGIPISMANIGYGHSWQDASLYKQSIDGYPAQIICRDGYLNIISIPSEDVPVVLTVSASTSCQINLLVAGTSIQLFHPSHTTTLSSQSVDVVDGDFSDDIDWDLVTHPVALDDSYDLVDYVQIVDIPTP